MKGEEMGRGGREKEGREGEEKEEWKGKGGG